MNKEEKPKRPHEWYMWTIMIGWMAFGVAFIVLFVMSLITKSRVLLSATQLCIVICMFLIIVEKTIYPKWKKKYEIWREWVHKLYEEDPHKWFEEVNK